MAGTHSSAPEDEILADGTGCDSFVFDSDNGDNTTTGFPTRRRSVD